MDSGFATLPLMIGAGAFVAAAAAYLVIAGLVLLTHPGTRQADWLVAALLVSALWAAAHVYLALHADALTAGLPVLDAAHLLGWLLFLCALLLGDKGPRISRTLGRTTVAGALVLFAIVAGQYLLAGLPFDTPVSEHTGLLAVLGLTLLGLLVLEQIYRNAADGQRPYLRWLVGGIGAVFIVDTFAYSQALLFSTLSPLIWALCALVNAAAAPALLLAVKRQPELGPELYVSRQLVFYTTALTGVGLYLFAVGIGGFIMNTGDASRPAAAQFLFFGLAGAVLVYILFSTDVRRSVRVFVNKHFFQDRYDYRGEWLRLTRALATENDEASLAERALQALGNIVASSGGTLWIRNPESRQFERRAARGSSADPESIAAADEMVVFLERTQWVVDTDEYRANPETYSSAFNPSGPWLASPSIVFPLIYGGSLVGIVKLDRPAILGDLDFKDHDLLKTAGQQVAVFLMQQETREALAQTRQFEAFSKLTTFLMHDLKNLISQQELVVGNAKRFRDRPEFVDDAIRTMDASVTRMRRLLDRLRGSVAPDQTSRIALDALVRRVCEDCADREPKPACEASSGLHVAMDREKLAMAVNHAIRNAQDATPRDGSITVTVADDAGTAVIEIRDTGSGMDKAFVRDELFKPFSSTKGARGMGIGAYQMRETMRAVGGDIEVESGPGQGTNLRFLVPVDLSVTDSSAQSVA